MSGIGIRRPGRPAKLRKKGATEDINNKKNLNRCSICKVLGHNRMKCPGGVVGAGESQPAGTAPLNARMGRGGSNVGRRCSNAGRGGSNATTTAAQRSTTRRREPTTGNSSQASTFTEASQAPRGGVTIRGSLAPRTPLAPITRGKTPLS